MNYLFFDVECAKCDKQGVGYICEFGYVLSDENFNILEENHFIINPNHAFDWYAIKNILHYSKDKYMSAPLFPEFYDTIKSVLSREEQYIIGHTTEADCKYIRSECQRYDLPLINCRYYDIRAPFKILQNEEQFSKLEKMAIKLQLKSEKRFHDALFDSHMTMKVCQCLCSIHGLSMRELLSFQKTMDAPHTK